MMREIQEETIMKHYGRDQMKAEVGVGRRD